MSALALLTLAMLAAVNPPAVMLAATRGEAPDRARRRRLAVPALAVALAVVGGAALLHDRWLDLLEVSAASFSLAAGIVMLAAGITALLRGRSVEAGLLATASGRAYASALAVPVLASPAALSAAVAYAERDGAGATLAAAAIALAAAAAASALAQAPLSARRELGLALSARALAALLVVLGAGLAVDGLRAV